MYSYWRVAKKNFSYILINKTAEDEQIKLETLTTKQIDFSNELRNLNKELALKEELHQKFIGNLSNFCSYENEANPSDKIQEYENIIVGLEKERDELNDKLKHDKSNLTSAKIAEEHRKKLELLKINIAELKKNLHQEKLLKLREKDSLRINNLNKDIQEKKSCKVKFICTMKVKSDNFRLWKTNRDRDRELCQLKEKERKRQNEIVRMNCLHLKQQNVLKRKVEEALAASKRLKTVIDKQKNAQTHRKGNKNSSKIDNIDVWLGNEIDIILSVLEAKQSLEYIIEDRTLITQRINDIKSATKTSSSSSSSTSSSFTDTTELETLEANLLIRNGQINDLNEKIIATNIDEKMKTIGHNIHHIPVAQTSLKHIFHTLVEMKKEISMKTEKYETIENEYEKNKKLLNY